MATRCYIFDLDGTLSDCEHRRRYVDGTVTPKDWDAFYAGAGEDPPIQHVVDLCNTLSDVGGIVYVTGRPERCREATLGWLRRHQLPDERLYMRADDDFRADDIVKGELLARIREDGCEPVMAFDDRDRVVKMWRANGVPCAQVAEGNF